MDIATSRLALRTRNAWEALDLGVRLWSEYKGLYTALWATYSLPLLALLSLLFWQAPWWIGLLLWWLKPILEAPILKVLSEQVFTHPPSYWACVRATWRLLWRPRLIGDLTWRRFSYHRSFLLPVTVLERLNGPRYRLRQQELISHDGGPAAWLSFLGMHIEAILTYGLLILGYWIWFGNPIQDALVQSASMNQAFEAMIIFIQSIGQDGIVWPYHTYNLLYALVLCFWGPIYIAAGFSLYLHARTLSEAWDIRLAAHRIAARLNHPLNMVMLTLCLGLAFLTPTTSVQAEPLPNVQQVEENRINVLTQPPFAHLKNQRHYCWRSCAETANRVENASLTEEPNLQSINTPLNILLYAVLALLLVAFLWLIWRWWGQSRVLKAHIPKTPETLFGLSITPQSLPTDVAAQVLHLWQQQDGRAAMSLLYRASLAQLPKHGGIALRDSDTEGEILQRVQQANSIFQDYWQSLTHVWLQQAYAHRSSSESVLQQLCQQYQQYFVRPELTNQHAPKNREERSHEA